MQAVDETKSAAAISVRDENKEIFYVCSKLEHERLKRSARKHHKKKHHKKPRRLNEGGAVASPKTGTIIDGNGNSNLPAAQVPGRKTLVKQCSLLRFKTSTCSLFLYR